MPQSNSRQTSIPPGKDIFQQNKTICDLNPEFRKRVSKYYKNEPNAINRVCKHGIDYDRFHHMRRIFWNYEDEYMVQSIKNRIKVTIEKYMEDNGISNRKDLDKKCVIFKFENELVANDIDIYIGDYDYKDCVSSFSVPLIDFCLNNYSRIYITKGFNSLKDKDGNPIQNKAKKSDKKSFKNYVGEKNIAMLKCRRPLIISRYEKNKFDYFDMVHIPPQ
jgi:hypothetical protein